MIGMEVERKVDFKRLGRQTNISARKMVDIAATARKIMQDRLNAGLDVDRSSMRGYSEMYKDYRAEMGKTTDVVNLEDSGKMRNSIQETNEKDNYIELTVNDHRKAAYQTNEDRNWWGNCRDAESQIGRDIERYLKGRV